MTIETSYHNNCFIWKENPPYQNWNATEVQKIEIFSKYRGDLADISSGEMYLERRYQQSNCSRHCLNHTTCSNDA